MDDVDKFIEFVEHVCPRRRMYVVGGSFLEVCAYFTGYAHASLDCPLSGKGSRAFNEFVCATFGPPGKYAWPYVLKECSRDDEEAIARLQRALTDFAVRTKTQSIEEIVRDVASQASRQKEGEPVKVWRKFSRAIHRDSREEIEPLIQEHPDAAILWSAACPDGIAPLLDQIQEQHRISVISGSEDDGEVTIIMPDFGPVGLKLIDGCWRIDASKVINCWKANRDRAEQTDTAGD